jgi:phosphoglycerate dehydrogenase-like enzyme
MLAGYEVDVLAYDPYAEESIFSELSVERVDRLDELFMRCEVISLHAPWLKETEGMVTGKLLRLMPPGATFINTSRGAVVNERDLLEVLRERPDLFAVLDVLIDETVFHAHPLARLPNVFITPHIAGSKGRESHRMGMTAVEECRRYLCGLPQLCALNQATTQSLA